MTSLQVTQNNYSPEPKQHYYEWYKTTIWTQPAPIGVMQTNSHLELFDDILDFHTFHNEPQNDIKALGSFWTIDLLGSANQFVLFGLAAILNIWLAPNLLPILMRATLNSRRARWLFDNYITEVVYHNYRIT